MPASLGWQAYIVIMLDIRILAITGIFFLQKNLQIKKMVLPLQCTTSLIHYLTNRHFKGISYDSDQGTGFHIW